MRCVNGMVVVATLTLLTACATRDQAQVKDAATAPLSDLNLVQADIPPVLQEAQKAPYGLPADLTCAGLVADIQALDAVLGADLDAPPSENDPSLLERGTDEAKKAAVSALRSTTQSVVPFRSWVRKLTGAERYSKKVAASITAGTVRRAFLKGLRVNQACPAPGAEAR